jgi:N-acetylglucosamine-6-phosphate deacetylase
MFRKRHSVTSTVGEAAGSLRTELAELGKQVERVRKRVERKQSHALRNTMFVLAGVGVAAAALPLLRSKVRRRDRTHAPSFSPKVVDAAIEVGVPVKTAYNQWTQFEEFPQFMDGIDEVTQLDETQLHWAATIAGRHAEWDAQIVEQEPDRRIAWETIDGGIVLCEDGRIRKAGRPSEFSPEPGSTIVQAAGRFVFPGLIDTHLHGGDGYDVDGQWNRGVLQSHRVSCGSAPQVSLPTIAARHGELLRAAEDVLEAEKSTEPGRRFSDAYRGPLHQRQVQGSPAGGRHSRSQRKRVPRTSGCGRGRIRIMTLAPELPGAFDLIRLLVSRGIIASLGHSSADYDTALAAIDAGATHATHLFNAMSGVTHRKPGLAAACLSEPRIRAEIICDGVHVDPRMIKLAARLKRPGELILITDASAAQGCPDGDYTLGGVEIRVRAPLCTLMDGVTIASSVLTMNRAVRNARHLPGSILSIWLGWARCCRRRSAALAIVRLNRGGKKDADLAVFDSEFNACQTVIAGEVVWQN